MKNISIWFRASSKNVHDVRFLCISSANRVANFDFLFKRHLFIRYCARWGGVRVLVGGDDGEGWSSIPSSGCFVFGYCL